jgi:hypothetical protein
VTKRASVRKLSAIYLALNGSPGIRTVLAKAPSGADMCGVAIAQMIEKVMNNDILLQR